MKRSKIRRLTELGVALALAAILNYIKVYQMPQGGSVSLEMIPIIFIAFRWGWKDGFLLGVAYGALQIILGGYIVHWVQAVLDYPLGFGVLGLAGLINITGQKGRKTLMISIGVILGGLARFIAHLLSGAIFFGDYAPKGVNVWVYSAGYNLSYILPEVIITVIVMIFLFKGLANTSLGEVFNNEEL